MLREAQLQGTRDALSRFGVKEADAGSWLASGAKNVARTLFGHPDKLFSPGGRKELFGPNGMMSLKGMFWPSAPKAGVQALEGAQGLRLTKALGPHAAGTVIDDKVIKALQRAGHTHVDATPTAWGKYSPWIGRTFGTLLPAYGVIQAARGKAGDPNKGRLSNTLGAVGSAAGFAAGFPLAGMLGSPYIAAAGQRLGTGIGRALGSRPTPPPPEQPMPDFMPYAAAHSLTGGMQ